MTAENGTLAAAIACHRDGRLTEARALYEAVLAMNAGNGKAALLLGVLCHQSRDLAGAHRMLVRAAELAPEDHEAWYNLGLTLKDMGQPVAAEAALRRALQANPRMVLAWYLLSVMLKEHGADDTADRAMANAIALDPGNASYRFRHALNATRRTPATAAEAAAVPQEFAARIAALAAWAGADPARYGQLRRAIGTVQPFFLAYRKGNHVAALSRYGDVLTTAAAAVPAGAALPAPQAAPQAAPRRRRTRLVVASAYICDHSVWQILVKGLVAHLDRERFELCIYHLSARQDAETGWARDRADVWRDSQTMTSAEAWLAQLRADAPDIIYYPEVGMDPVSVFLAAHRVAPLQAVGWGHPLTSGLATMDLFLSGELLEPRDADAHYREHLVRLPGTGCCSLTMAVTPRMAPAIAAALPEPGIPRFIIAQQPFKFDPAEAVLLARIAAAAGPCAVLFPKPDYAGWGFERVMEAVRQAFAAHGLDPKAYVRAVPWAATREEFYGLLDACDVFLDLPNFSGYTTAWQAAHCGLPIVTLEGGFMRQRMAAALLRQIGLPETIAADAEAYAAIAVRLAREASPEARRQRRAALKTAAALADGRTEVVRAFEDVLSAELARRLGLRPG